jgi:type IV secretion system protein VirB9
MTCTSILALASAAGILAGAFSPAKAAGPDARALATHMLHMATPGRLAVRAGHPAKTAAIVRVAAANRAAIREPDPDYYLGAAQVYPWSDGSLYRLYAAPGQISDIALQPGEALISVAAGDTARWIIGDTASGTGAARRTHILVKPAAAGLRTNLVIATDRRIYHVEAVSTSRTAMAAISWTYPQDNIITIQPTSSTVTEPIVSPAVAVEALNFDYRIDGDRASWRPVRVFDDGHQTFIEFPANLGDGEAPPLFVIGADGKAQLVNYRVKGRYYVVDRLFAAAELRLGGKHQQIVRIARDHGGRRSGRPA